MFLTLINMKLFTSLMLSGKAKVMAVLLQLCKIWQSMAECDGRVWWSVAECGRVW